MQKSFYVFSMLIGLVSFSLLAASADAQTPGLNKQQNISESDVYTCFFRLVVSSETKSSQVAASEEKDFFHHLFQEKANLSEEHYNALKTVARSFVSAHKTTPKKDRSALIAQYRNEITGILGDDFIRFNQYITGEFTGNLVVLNSNAPQRIFAGAFVRIDQQNYKLIGEATTIWDDTLSERQQVPCSVSATMSGPGVSQSGSDSLPEGCYARSLGLTLTSTTYTDGAQYCIEATFTGVDNNPNIYHCINTQREPIIFIPGIMGSVMKGPYQGQTVQYWTNFIPSPTSTITTVRNLTLDTTSPYYRGTGIYASDVLRQVATKPIYKPLLDFFGEQRLRSVRC